MTPRNPNIFANNPLDRASDKRVDPAWIAAQLQDDKTLIVPFRNLNPFIITAPGSKKREVGFVRPALVKSMLRPDVITIFLGLDKHGAYFAIDASEGPDPSEQGPLEGLGTFADLRGVAMEIPAGDAAILAQGKSLIDWHKRHQFCAQCGAPTRAADAGYKRLCGACKAEHFPRTDPVVIMLATRDDQCLLGRGPQWPKGFYSALAGFLEPGETIEDAVIRELREETGVTVGNVQFYATQPWPYPSSLMIGCFAEAETEAVTVDGVEIEHARWFTREEVLRILDGKGEGLFAPPPLAIAHHLIKTWATKAG